MRSATNCPCCKQGNRCAKAVPSNSLAALKPEIAKEWDYHKNNKTPWDYTPCSFFEANWVCKKGHSWKTRIVNRTKGAGCPICNESKGEKAIREYLKCHLHESEWRQQLVTKMDRPDFVLIKHKSIIEYCGIQHYVPVSFGSGKPNAKYKNLMNNIRRDDKKIRRAKTKKIPLLMIPFWDIDNIPKIMDDFLAGRTPTFSSPPEKVHNYKKMREMMRDTLGIKDSEILCGLVS
jgi:hypothetical protein